MAANFISFDGGPLDGHWIWSDEDVLLCTPEKLMVFVPNPDDDSEIVGWDHEYRLLGIDVYKHVPVKEESHASAQSQEK